MYELTWLARGVVGGGVGLLLLAVLCPTRLNEIAEIDRRSVGIAGVVVVVVGAILVAIAGV